MDLKAQKTLAAAVFEAQKTISPYTTTATVTSISGDTAYVKIAGSDISTPVEASTVTVKPGDTVDLSVSHADTHITGNRSDKSVTESSVQKTAEVKIVKILQDKYITAEKIETTYIKSEKVEADYITAKEIESKYFTSEYIKSNYITASDIKSKYADIKLSNVDKNDIGTLLANIGLISTAMIIEGHVTGYLNSVKINADIIDAGTLSIKRLAISGTNDSIIYAINNSGELVSDTVDTIDGDVITEKTIRTQHIVAEAITSSEIHANAITSEKIAEDAVTYDKINVDTLESISDKIGSFTIHNSIYTNEHSAYNSNVNGVYIGSDYISFGNGGKTWIKNDGAVSIGSGAILYNAESDRLDIHTNSLTISTGTRSIMIQDGSVYAKNTNYNGGSYLDILDGLNENGNTTLGYGGYINNIGSTNIYGEKVLLRSNSGITIEDTVGNEGLRVYGTDQVSIGYHGYSNNQGITYLSGYDVWVKSSNYVYSDRRLKILWSGEYQMGDDQEISLTDTISNQLTGVVLAWSAYENNASGNYDWNYIFVPKEHVLRHSGNGVAMLLISGTGLTRGSKYVYIFDNKITGHANNNKVSTEENGWIVNPSGFVLRYVYGV